MMDAAMRLEKSRRICTPFDAPIQRAVEQATCHAAVTRRRPQPHYLTLIAIFGQQDDYVSGRFAKQRPRAPGTPHSGPGRPSKFTDDRVQRFLAAIRAGACDLDLAR